MSRNCRQYRILHAELSATHLSSNTSCQCYRTSAGFQSISNFCLGSCNDIQMHPQPQAFIQQTFKRPQLQCMEPRPFRNRKIFKFVKKFIERFPNYHISKHRPNYVQKWQQELLNAWSSNPFFSQSAQAIPTSFYKQF